MRNICAMNSAIGAGVKNWPRWFFFLPFTTRLYLRRSTWLSILRCSLISIILRGEILDGFRYEKSSEILPFQYIIDQHARLSIYLGDKDAKNVDFVTSLADV